MTTPPTIKAAVTNTGIRNGNVRPTAPTNVISAGVPATLLAKTPGLMLASAVPLLSTSSVPFPTLATAAIRMPFVSIFQRLFSRGRERVCGLLCSSSPGAGGSSVPPCACLSCRQPCARSHSASLTTCSFGVGSSDGVFIGYSFLCFAAGQAWLG
jgi:hypothetical protein